MCSIRQLARRHVRAALGRLSVRSRLIPTCPATDAPSTSPAPASPGLTLALALAKFGATVVVLERNKQVQEVGAGLQISPNARQVLNRLGARQGAARTAPSSRRASTSIPSAPARRWSRWNWAARCTDRFGAPYAVMHRADLAELLHRACKRFANIDMLFGVRAYDVVSHARGVSVTVDEADGKSRSARAFAFIGADGVNSRTRTDVLMGPAGDLFRLRRLAHHAGPVGARRHRRAGPHERCCSGPAITPSATRCPIASRSTSRCSPRCPRSEALGDIAAQGAATALGGSAAAARFKALLAAAGDDWGYLAAARRSRPTTGTRAASA